MRGFQMQLQLQIVQIGIGNTNYFCNFDYEEKTVGELGIEDADEDLGEGEGEKVRIVFVVVLVVVLVVVNSNPVHFENPTKEQNADFPHPPDTFPVPATTLLHLYLPLLPHPDPA